MTQAAERSRQDADQRRSLLADLQHEQELQLIAQRQAAAAAAAENATDASINETEPPAEENE